MKASLYGSTNPDFRPTAGQRMQALMAGTTALHCMAYGGAGSAKTFGWLCCVILRLIAIPHRALAVRRHFKHARTFLGMQSIPEVMSVVWPGIAYEVNKSDWYITFPGGGELWLGGLDDGARMDKILGPQYSTIFVNECSEIIDYDAVTILRTRLRQKSKGLANKMFYDQNPPAKSHWTYREFELGINPSSKDEAIPDHEARFVSRQINPNSNWDNLSPEYKSTLESMPERQRRRFLLGEYADEVEDALWQPDTIDHYRINPDQVPELVSVVVACDPAVTANANSDETGIVVAGKGRNGHVYVLDDATLKAHPRAWGERLVALYGEHRADVIVAEVNNGGDLVEVNIRGCPGGANVAYQGIHASRGKITRAEPVAAMYERGLVHHAGTFRYLEDELTTYCPAIYDSPNRLDALVWACTRLAGIDATQEVMRPSSDWGDM